ncbi:MAG: hypothetical protein [Caudoviricetes sp.]|nr:MAG: hypothetical protein [Caudoviricetes sp.]
MLSVSKTSHENYEEDTVNGVGIYRSALTLTYDISNTYDVTGTDNDIHLYITYNGVNLSAKTNFTFLKEGEPGTNGTEFVCKIIPNITSGDIPAYPIVTQNGLTNGSQWTFNFAPYPATTYFRVQLWRNGVNIFSGTTSGTSQEGKPVIVSWDILRNRYRNSIYDRSSFTVNSDTGVFGNYQGYDIGNEDRYGWKAAIVKVTVEYDELTYYSTLPIIERKVTNKNTYDISLKEKTGFKYATYTSDGVRPKYDNSNPFKIIVKEYINGKWDDISLNDSISYQWNIKGKVFENSTISSGTTIENWSDSINLEDRTDRTKADKNTLVIRPVDAYDGYCVTNSIECVVKKNNSEIGRINIPIHLLLNRYSNANLNSWDGNNISISEDGGFILAPQVGAGKKESNNSFTGVVLGVVKESGKTGEETGLFGYSSGQRSIFLDADTGKAEFGTSTSGRIIIDPSSREALIYSSNYSESGEKGGLRINLTNPEIKFGTGNFVVNTIGHLTAKGGGSIAGWEITDDKLYSKNRSITLDASKKAVYSGTKTRDNISANGFFIDPDDLILGSKVRIDKEGIMEIGLGAAARTSSPRWTISGSGTSANSRSFISHGYNIFGGEIPPRIAEGGFKNSSVYVGTDGIAVGAKIRMVSSSGTLVAEGAELSKVSISNSKVTGTEVDGYTTDQEFTVGINGVNSTINTVRTDLDGKITTTNSKLTQTANKLQSVYSSSVNKFDLGTLQNVIYGYGSPPDVNTYPASNYRGKNYVDQNTGDHYYSNGTTWTKQGTLTLVSTILSNSITQTAKQLRVEMAEQKTTIDGEMSVLKGDITVTAQKLNSVYTSSINKYDTSALGSNVMYGYGAPSVSAYPPGSYNGKYFVNQTNGQYYYCNGSSWSYRGTLTLVSTNLQSSIEQTAKNITLKVEDVDKKINGNNIVSLINMTQDSVTIQAKKVNLTGGDIVNILAKGTAQIEAKNLKLTGNGLIEIINTGNTKIKAENITLDGNVLFKTDVSASGTTKIYGDRIEGGTISLGGSGNGNGQLYVKDSSSINKVILDNSGITATAGTIGGFSISSLKIYGTSNDGKVIVMQKGTSAGMHGFAVGGTSHTNYSDCPFRVTMDGSLYASKGTVGGFTIGSSKIYGTSNDGRVIAIQKPSSSSMTAFAAGGTSHSSYSDCPFRVSMGGKLYSTDAEIKGSIIATSMNITGTLKIKGVLIDGMTTNLRVENYTLKFQSGLLYGYDYHNPEA